MIYTSDITTRLNNIEARQHIQIVLLEAVVKAEMEKVGIISDLTPSYFDAENVLRVNWMAAENEAEARLMFGSLYDDYRQEGRTGPLEIYVKDK